MVIKHIGVWSLARILAIVYAALGIVIGFFFAFFSLISAAAGAVADVPGLGMIFGVGAIFILPIMYGIIGLVGGLIIGLIYNAIAGSVGGIEIELE